MAALSLRRNRLNRAMRELTRDVRLSGEQFIQPLFVVEGITEREPVNGLDGVFRETPDSLAAQIEADLAAGTDKFLLFGVPAEKRNTGFVHDFTAEQVRRLAGHFGTDAWIAVDVCLCSHTPHGHCGILNEAGDLVVNDASVEALAAEAVTFAQAGADCVAPSDMMDGRVAAIREGLAQAGHETVAIMSYAAKFHSGFYGPFRDAADSAPSASGRLTDRATYQLDPARPRDARLSAERDAAEGADILMVKPGLPYLDVLAELSNRIPLPWAVYQTSGEQAAIDRLAAEGLMNGDLAQRETWQAFVRAGANCIISYAARRAARVLSR